jgi:hypothetical protein
MVMLETGLLDIPSTSERIPFQSFGGGAVKRWLTA